MRRLDKSEKSRPSTPVNQKTDTNLLLKKACLKATLSAIEMEIKRFEQKLKTAMEEPGDPVNAPLFKSHIRELRAEHEMCNGTSPSEYELPEKKKIKVKTTNQYKQGSLLELKGMSRSGPFYHVAGIRGDDYKSLKPGETYRLTIYPVYPRDYPFSGYYVYVKDVQ